MAARPSPRIIPTQAEASSGRDIRVLLIVTSLCHGGAERQVVELAVGFARRGLTAAVMSLRSNGTVLKQRLLEAGIPLYELGMPPGRPTLVGLLRALRAVRQFRPSVIHSHMYHANILARVLRPISPGRVLICTAHNCNEGGRLR